ncbi:UNVERIFIED_CONTAM: Subtilisin-like protease SBT4.6 [Sesamum radiatum]|uniref:Subtilisin-like protease SBT4.6 n=1 Tax=Sesamum radiatum TaxID=300843 RepID=A0AAW2N072_SESRA
MGSLPRGDYSTHESNKLQNQHSKMLQEVVDSSFLSQALVRSYKRSFNGFAASLTNQEQQRLASFSEVVSIFPSRVLWPQTTRSWEYMGLKENVNPNPNTGSDIVIGVLDSGIWPESESFSDKGFGPIPAKWKGVCNGGKNFTCNKKLVGARFYTTSIADGDSARDLNGHGSHTASTAAGNYVKNTSFYGIAQGTARGGIPSARIAAYKVCGEGCRDADILAGFDDAIADGVDIITISIGAQIAINMRYDSIAIGSLHAMQKGILTLHSAGNGGFFPGSVISVAPWLFTIGASSIDRGIVSKVSLGNGKTIVGKAVNAFEMNGTEFPLVYGKDVTSGCDETQARSCSPGCLDTKLVSGKIVLCDSSNNVKVALSAGAAGTIVKSGIAYDVSFVFPLPASALLIDNLKLVKDYINSTNAAKAFISTSESIKNTNAPLVASFSAKGPNPIISEILKPDITAPGVEILAAYSPLGSVSSYGSDKGSANYSILSGTSMSCPHAAGAAAYHGLWILQNKDAEFSYGAGHLNPINATNPGLVYETNEQDYVKLLCNIGYPTESIRKLFNNDSINCPKQVGATINDFNYPSISLQVKQGVPFSASFTRTVTNVGPANSTYTARINKPANFDITVEPGTLSFKQLNEKKSFVVTVKGDRITSMISASLVWSDGIHSVRSPIVLY